MSLTNNHLKYLYIGHRKTLKMLRLRVFWPPRLAPYHKWHRPWCENDTRTLSWRVCMHQVMVLAKAADHHGASGIAFSPATRVIFFT